MALTTYQEVEDEVINWIDREDLRARFNTWITLTTEECSKQLRTPAMENTVLLAIDEGGKISIPSDYIEAISVNHLFEYEDDDRGTNGIKGRNSLNRSDPKIFNNSAYLEVGGATNFARVGNEFIIFPIEGRKEYIDTPNPSFEDFGYIELYYYKLLPALEEAGDTNWLLTVSPEVYFYGCMYHAHQFIKDFDAAEYWGGKFIQGIQSTQQKADRDEFTGGFIQSGVGMR